MDTTMLERAEQRLAYCERELNRFLQGYDGTNPRTLRKLGADAKLAALDLRHAREAAAAQWEANFGGI